MLLALTTYAYIPGEGFATGRTTSAYLVPAVTFKGVTRFAAKYPPALVENPGIVAVARSAPVGRSPVVFLIETVRFGVVPVQPLQKRSTSTRVNDPLTVGVNV